MIPERRGAVKWRLTQEERMRILGAYLVGEKIDVIAARFGVDRAYPAKLARQYRCPRRPMTRTASAQIDPR